MSGNRLRTIGLTVSLALILALGYSRAARNLFKRRIRLLKCHRT
jgi:hypothetical protein